MTHLKITLVADLDFKNIPEDIKTELVKMLKQLKAKKGKNGSTINVEEVTK